MIIEDKTKIKKATPKYNFEELNEDKFIKEFNTLQELKTKLDDKRNEVRSIEEEVEKQNKKVKLLSELFDIEYENKKVNYIHNNTFLEVINREDARHSY